MLPNYLIMGTKQEKLIFYLKISELVNCDIFKFVNSELFLDKLSGIDLHKNRVNWLVGHEAVV